MKIPFNRPSLSGKEIEYMADAVSRGHISGDGWYTKKCEMYLEKAFGVRRALLTTSCTHALEMSALLLNIEPGDEVICPSFSFTSTVNPFVLRGARPIFVDIRPDTLNINERMIDEHITKKTKAIVVIHYSGIACEMDTILNISRRHNIPVIEDAAQCIYARYKNRYLGTMGTMGSYSFHETKNIYCGEGGVLLVNYMRYIKRAEVIREKGTNRNAFFRHEVGKYEWVDIGSSYIPSDILSAFLYAQLQRGKRAVLRRKKLYLRYIRGLMGLEEKGQIKLPVTPHSCAPNYHTFYILLRSEKQREKLRRYLLSRGIYAIIHYIPLHTSFMGRRFGYKKNDLPQTEYAAARLLRLPLFNTITAEEIDYIVDAVYNFFKQ